MILTREREGEEPLCSKAIFISALQELSRGLLSSVCLACEFPRLIQLTADANRVMV